MADLDDFFAKKDRKKGKSKKLTPSEELARKIEDTSKPSQSAKKRDCTPGQEDEDGVVAEEVIVPVNIKSFLLFVGNFKEFLPSICQSKVLGYVVRYSRCLKRVTHSVVMFAKIANLSFDFCFLDCKRRRMERLSGGRTERLHWIETWSVTNQ